MDLPHSRQRQEYIDQIKEIEAELKGSTATKTSSDKIKKLQEQLDVLAKQYQYKDEIGSARYKLYELQAFIYYFEHKDEQALDFIGQAIEMRGASYSKAEKLKENISIGASSSKKTGIMFFHKSPVTVFWLSFLTLGLYGIYWFYKHWRVIRVSTGVRTWPILSSIFQIFTAYSLFKRIKDNASKHKYELRGVGWMAVAFIIVTLLSNSVARSEINSITAGTMTQTSDIIGLLLTIIFSVVIALILATVQRAANAHNVGVTGGKHRFRRIYPGEIIFSIIGISLFVLTMYQYGHDITLNQYPAGTQAEISAEGAKFDSLQVQYDACSASLNSRYNSLDTTSSYEIDSYNNDFDDCEDTRLELNESAARYNQLAGYDN